MNNLIIRSLLFLLISCWLTYISWKPLHSPRSHGFYRFFAWETIVAIVLMNIPSWFTNPFSLRQVVSWFLLAASLVSLGLGYNHLRSAGKPVSKRQGTSLYEFEKTSTLVTTGIYRFIRHPLYASLLFLAWGAFLKDITWFCTILVALATVFLIATAKAEEAECIQYFGPAYEKYMERTSMFVPGLF